MSAKSRTDKLMELAPDLPQTEVAVMVMGEEGDVLLGHVGEGFDKGRVSVPIGGLKPFEPVSDAAARIVQEWSGLAVDPQHTIFVCESIHPDSGEHRIIIFVFAKLLPGQAKPSGQSFFHDVRKLGDWQNEMSDTALDGFQKFSIVLRRQAQKG